MNILHVIDGLAKAAGTSVFCCEVANGLVAAGHDVAIAVGNPDASDAYKLDSRIKLISINTLLAAANLASIIPYPSLVHIHALWSPTLHMVSKWAYKNKIPVVWSPHGMLTKWAMKYKWWKKLPAWWVYQKRDLSRARFIHATAQSEVDDIRRVGLKNKVIIAPLGVNISYYGEISRGGGTALFVSRIQKKKGLATLIKAWARILEMGRLLYTGRVAPIKGLDHLCEAIAKVDMSGWRLVIVGPDQEGHTAELKELANKLGVLNSIEFLGPKYEDDLAKEYDSADIFVLPSYSENFGSVVVEALAHGVPVITTKGTPWQELEDHKCGWWIDIGVEPLVEALIEAMSLTDGGRREMGMRGRKLVEQKYTWDVVVNTMAKAYEEVVSARA